MNEDYLWDKSGEPDPQIQQLEEILGTLRYQPKPLKLRRRSYWPLLAIAAAVAFVLLAGGLWIQTRNEIASIPQVAIATPAPSRAPVTQLKTSSGTTPPKSVIKRPGVGISKRERKEALVAKEQVMMALRLASEKLNLAQRKTQHRAG